MMDRAAIEAIVTKWEKWAAREMWISEYLHPRARTALVTELAEALWNAKYGQPDAQPESPQPRKPGRPRKESVE